MTEINFAIYKSYTENDEISKSLAMKKVLGWSDEEIEENFVSLMKDKQLVAIADYFADKISDENPPVDFKSPIRLKADVDKQEQPFAAGGEGTEEGTGEEASSGGESGEENPSEEPEAEEPDTKEAETPTFGLG